MRIMWKKRFCAWLFGALCSAASLSAQADALEFEIVYVGDTDSSAYLGVQQGLEEANLQGRFLGQQYRVTERSADDALAESEGIFAILVSGDAETIKRISAAAAGIPVMNLDNDNDGLRSACLANAFHVGPSARMKADAEAQWRQRDADAPARAQGWHEDFVKFAARDLNRRFLEARGVVMDDASWAGWAAVRIISDAVAQGRARTAAELHSRLRGSINFDGQKGIELNFRTTGQLAQPLLLVQDGQIVAEAPVRGVADDSDLDSLGLVDCEE